MPWPAVSFRSELSEVVRKELDQFAAQMTSVLSPEHQSDGSHGPITTPSIAVRGAATVGGALTVGGNITTKGSIAADGNITTKGSLAADGNITTKGSLTAAGAVNTPTLKIGAGTPLTHYEEAIYVPRVLGASGAPFTLGASTISGWYSQLGTAVTFEVRLVLGAGYVWPLNEVMVFTLPKPRAGSHLAGTTVLQMGGTTGEYYGGGGLMLDVPGSAVVLLTLPKSDFAASGKLDFVGAAAPFAAAVGHTYGFFGSFRTTGLPRITTGDRPLTGLVGTDRTGA